MMNRREFGLIAGAGAAALVPRFAHAAPVAGWEQDAVWVKGNTKNGYRFTVRTSLPTNARWPATYSNTFQMQTEMGDVERADLERALFYGNPFDPFANPRGGFFGIDCMYGTCDLEKAQNAVNVLDGKSRTRRKTSIWLMSWGKNTAFMVTPNGLRPGAEEIVTAAVVLIDWRYVVHIRNVDIADAVNRPWLVNQLMTQALVRLPTIKRPQTFFYTSEKMARALRLARINTRGIPIRAIGALRDDETVVLA